VGNRAKVRDGVHPRELFPGIIPLVRDEQVRIMINSLERYTDNVMENDAGDTCDERVRVGIAVKEILVKVKTDIDPALLRLKHTSLPYTQKVISEVLKERRPIKR
jgi:hypothetical protein